MSSTNRALALGTIVLMALVGRFQASAQPDKKTDKELLQGVWTVTSAREDGQPQPDEKLSDMRMEYKGDKVALMQRNDDVAVFSYTIDPTKKPAQIAILVEQRGKPATVNGIYKIDGDTLILCLAPKGPLPTKFSADKGEGAILFTLRRGGKAIDWKFAGLAAKRAQNLSNISQLSLALHIYLDEHNKTFPPPAALDKDGKPLLSWRVLILPYLEQGELYKQFKLDEAWDSPHNIKLLAKMPAVFGPELPQAEEKYSTYYQVFVGPGTIFEGPKGCRLRDIKDGLSNTILLVDSGRAVPWTKPEELSFDPNKDVPQLGGVVPGYFAIAWGDRSVMSLSGKINQDMMRRAIQRNDGLPVDHDKLTTKSE